MWSRVMPMVACASFFCDELIDEVDEQLRSTCTLDGAAGVFRGGLQRLGFSSFAYLRFERDRCGAPIARAISQYPQEWCHRYVEANHFSVDPTLWHCANRITPVAWHSLRLLEPSWCESSDVFEEAHGYGLHNGIAVPLHSGNGGFSLLNATTDLYGEESERLVRVFQHMVHMMSLVFHKHIENRIVETNLHLPEAKFSYREINRFVRQMEQLQVPPVVQP
jgi:hypothetical protein